MRVFEDVNGRVFSVHMPVEHIKEDNKMKATSVQNIKNVKDICISASAYPMGGPGETLSIMIYTDDDIFEFNFEGQDLVQKCKEIGLFTGWEKDQKIRELEKELGEWKKEAADCLRLRDEVIREKNEEIDKLNQQLQQVKNDNKRLTYRYKALENQYTLEKTANEAQHRAIRECVGKGTEVQFNYAIDDVKEVSYVIVDKEEYNKNFEKWANAQVENAPASASRANILDQAKKCVCGQREQDYGTPESNFQLIADLWNGYLFPSLQENKAVISPTDVSMMMALMKIARIRNGGGSGDSFVDLAGYAACGGEIWHGQKAKDQN